MQEKAKKIAHSQGRIVNQNKSMIHEMKSMDTAGWYEKVILSIQYESLQELNECAMPMLYRIVFNIGNSWER